MVNEIINGRKQITPQTAAELAEALGTSPELWINLETAYQLSKSSPPDPQIAKRAQEMARRRLAMA
jgi:HTH-type transcriptional regulator/antitoxin HigA